VPATIPAIVAKPASRDADMEFAFASAAALR
jgi:hypothetical protein